jgi:hypothetical protein
MARVFVTQYVIEPDGYAEAPFMDKHHFILHVVRRTLDGSWDPEEWSVCRPGFHGEAYTRTGKLVGVRGSDRLNRRHAVFDLATALDLAHRLVDGELVTREYRTLKDAVAQWRLAT